MNDARNANAVDQSRIDTLVAEYLRRIDAGEDVNRDEFIARHPDLADAFCQYLDSPAFAMRLIAGDDAPSASEAETCAIPRAGEDTSRPRTTTPQAGGGQPIPERFGRYRIVKELGHGAMASVYLAQDMELQRRVALKIPKFSPQEDPEVLERFYREARAAATLGHPNICPIFDVGEHDGRHFIAMGYVEGRPLEDYIKSGKRQPERQAASVIRKVALALDEAHRQGILHRDLKPANIMIDQRREPIVMDFGLAYRMDDQSESRLTRDGCIIGTPAYMSPEQIDNRSQVGPASDVYSLGVVFYELLTGQRPFTGSVVSVFGQVLHVTPKAVAELRPEVSPPLADICERAMAKSAEDRYDSMKELAGALRAFLKGEPSADSSAALVPIADTQQSDLEAMAPLPSPPIPAISEPRLAPRPAPYRTAPSKKTNRTVWLIAGGAAGLLAILVILAVAIIGWMSGEDDSRPMSESAPGKTHPMATTDDAAVPEERFTGEPRARATAEVRGYNPPESPPSPAGKPPYDEFQAARGGHDIRSRADFDQRDRNRDGKLDSREYPPHIINRADADKDGELAFEEVSRALEKLGQSLFRPPSPDELRGLPPRHSDTRPEPPGFGGPGSHPKGKPPEYSGFGDLDSQPMGKPRSR